MVENRKGNDTDMGTMRILIAEDDEGILAGLEYALSQEGYEVTACGDAASARQALEAQEVDLCLLDVTLPDGNGYELCRLAREKGEVPVIFLTACDAEVNVVMGLDMGADDYITKPFRIRELTSRIRSVLRRCRREPDGGGAETVIFGNVRIRPTEARVFRTDGGGEREVQLTALEYRLLLTFVSHRGKLLSRNQLLESIWDAAGDFVNDNTVSVYIKRLREKLEENPAEPKLIQTVRGFGYRSGGERNPRG